MSSILPGALSAPEGESGSSDKTPDKPAVVMAESGARVTYRELDEGSIRLARVWREAGLQRGDHVALLADNQTRYFEVYWAAVRSGLYLTAVNRYLSAEERVRAAVGADNKHVDPPPVTKLPKWIEKLLEKLTKDKP